jgi:formin-binding protein 1
MMFVRHNVASWQAPADFMFEPSPVWLDDGSLATDDTAVNFLRNVLTKSKGQLAQLRRDLDQKRREIEAGERVKQNVREGKDKRDEVEVVRTIFVLQEALHEIERQKVTAEVEVLTITSVVGDVSIGAKNHNFKSQTFKIPTNCDLCGDRIWGLSAKGFDCRDCGYTCHSKCEMKVPADCPGEQTKEEKKKLKEDRQKAASARMPTSPTNGAPSAVELPGDIPGVGRSNTVNSMNTLSSGYSASAQRSISGGPLSPTLAEEAPEKPPPVKTGPRTNRILAPPPAQYIKDLGQGPGSSTESSRSSEQRGKMLYAYQENGEGEITVTEGKDVVILEPDGTSTHPFFLFLTIFLTWVDGSGWIKVKAGYQEGLVPASYVEVSAATPPSSARPASTYSGSSVSLAGSITAPGNLKKKGPAVAPKRGAKKLKYVEAIYEYQAQSDAEHSMAEGERFVLINMDAGDGWADVEKGGVVKSVPANYIQET